LGNKVGPERRKEEIVEGGDNLGVGGDVIGEESGTGERKGSI